MKVTFASYLIVTFLFQAEAIQQKPLSVSEALDPVDEAANLYPTNDEFGPMTVEAIILAADKRIRQTIEQAPYLAATYLRLGFHDCVPNGEAGGCDGCLNLSNPSNFGLLPAVEALQPIVTDLENPILGVSRADIWAYAVLVAADVSQSNLVFTGSVRVGRKNCETVGTCDANSQDCSIDGPDQVTDFPSSDYTTHQLLRFMHSHFGFDSDQTVAIMGAHTLGFAFPHHSGYEGKYGWVSNTQSLDNEYYRYLTGKKVDWTQIQVPSGKYQWVPTLGGTPFLMLNIDVAIVRDLNKKMNPDGEATCTFLSPPASKCPIANTLTKVDYYAVNNIAWLKDFKRVLTIMVEKGL